jgi:membrane protease YdiL (CAAX protease family)
MAAGILFGGEWKHAAYAGWQAIPFAALAVLAYWGDERWWARPIALIGLCVVVFGAAALLAFVSLVVALAGSLPETRSEEIPATTFMSVVVRLLVMCLGLGGAVLIAAAGLIPFVRRSLARVLPIDPHSFVHAIALVAVVALSLVSILPLLVLAAPPFLTLVVIMLEQGEDLTDGRGTTGMLLDELYGLVWLVPCTVFAVGYGIRRTLSESLQRLGLVRPSVWQVAAALGLAVAMVLAVAVLSPAIDWTWDALGWPKTDVDSFEHLVAHFFSPLGALVIGIVAGLGEELAVRGVLQPRLGIWLSNAFFTSCHALQYHWDSLLGVFLIGLVLGVIRKKTNTTTSAITHGTYDFLLIMAAVLQIPGFTE